MYHVNYSFTARCSVVKPSTRARTTLDPSGSEPPKTCCEPPGNEKPGKTNYIVITRYRYPAVILTHVKYFRARVTGAPLSAAPRLEPAVPLAGATCSSQVNHALLLILTIRIRITNVYECMTKTNTTEPKPKSSHNNQRANS